MDTTDPLAGPPPTWRPGDEPIYLSVLADLGVPGLDTPATPGMVVVGEVA